MQIEFKAILGYNATLGDLTDAVEQAHLAGFTQRECSVIFTMDGNKRAHLYVTRDTDAAEPTEGVTE